MGVAVETYGRSRILLLVLNIFCLFYSHHTELNMTNGLTSCIVNKYLVFGERARHRSVKIPA
jgi:hypothetical protein